MSVGTAAPKLAAGRARTPAVERSLAGAWAGVAVLTLLAALLRFYRIGHQGFWFDEANTALLVHFSPGKMLGLIPQSESTPPLYYCVAWVWAHLFGYGETALRSLSAVCGVATVPVAYGAARRLVSVRAGLFAAALTAFSPLLIWYSQEARSYAMLVLLASGSLLAMAYLLERPGAATAAAWVIASALALATHYYAVLIVAPEAAWLLWIHRRQRVVLVAVGIIALCGLALIPLAISQNGTGHSSWIAHAALGRRIKEIPPQFVAGFNSPAYGVLEPVALVLAALGLVMLIPRSDDPGRRGALLAAGIALTGLVLGLVLIVVGFDDLLTRNVLPLWMPAAVAVAGGFAVARPRLVGLAATAVLCVIGVVAAIGVARDRNLQRPDWRPVAALLGPRPTSGSRAILIQHYRDLLPLSLYLRGLRFLRGPGQRVSELDVVSFTSPQSAGFCWWGSACNLWPSRAQPSYAIAGFRPVWRRQVNQFTVLHLVASGRPVSVSGGVVEPALRTTRYRNDELLIQHSPGR